MADPESLELGMRTLAHEMGHVFTKDRQFVHHWDEDYDADPLMVNNIMGYNSPGPDHLAIIDLTLRQGYIANKKWKERHDRQQ